MVKAQPIQKDITVLRVPWILKPKERFMNNPKPVKIIKRNSHVEITKNIGFISRSLIYYGPEPKFTYYIILISF